MCHQAELFPWYLAQAKADKSAVFIVATTGRKQNFTRMLSVRPSAKGTQTVTRTTAQNQLAMAKWHPFSFFRTAPRPFATLQHDPITCKVAAENTRRMARCWPCLVVHFPWLGLARLSGIPFQATHFVPWSHKITLLVFHVFFWAIWSSPETLQLHWTRVFAVAG
jgi:hypothetical protein